MPGRRCASFGELYGVVQANANGLVQTVQQASGPVTLRRGAPGLGEHRGELLREAPEAE